MFKSFSGKAALFVTGAIGFAIVNSGCTVTVQNDPAPTPASSYYIQALEVCPTVHEGSYYLANYQAQIRVSGYVNSNQTYIGDQPSGMLSPYVTLNGNGSLVPGSAFPCVRFELGDASAWSDNIDITDPKIDINADGLHTGAVPYGDAPIVYDNSAGYYFLRLFVDADLNQYTDSTKAIENYYRKKALKDGWRDIKKSLGFDKKATALLDDGEERGPKNAPSKADLEQKKPEQAGKMEAI